jgi:hypothetical protein
VAYFFHYHYTPWRAGQAIAAGDLRHVAGDVNLGEVAVCGKDQDALGRLAEGKRFLAVRRNDLGHAEIPSPDDLVAQAFLLCRGVAACQRNR